MSGREWGDVIAAVFVLAIVAVLVRPGSLAPTFVSAIGAGLKNLITYAVAS